MQTFPRAIVRNATGNKYWKEFSATAQQEVESLARDTYKALYSPPLNPPIRTDDLPIAGHGYGSQTLPLIFDFVNIANGLPVIDASKAKNMRPDKSQPDESATLNVLRTAERMARRMTGVHASSLGLHPAVYFYSASGRHQPTAVLAMAALIVDLEAASKFSDFTKVRAAFEDFLVEHKAFINQITTKYGSMAKGYRQMKDYFSYVLEGFIAGRAKEEVVSSLATHDRYHTLVKENPITTKKVKDFSQATKQFAFLRDALSKTFQCHICGARIDTKAMQLDHAIDKKAGGLGDGENAKWAHPYCNSTFKYSSVVSASESSE